MLLCVMTVELRSETVLVQGCLPGCPGPPALYLYISRCLQILIILGLQICMYMPLYASTLTAYTRGVAHRAGPKPSTTLTMAYARMEAPTVETTSVIREVCLAQALEWTAPIVASASSPRRRHRLTCHRRRRLVFRGRNRWPFTFPFTCTWTSFAACSKRREYFWVP